MLVFSKIAIASDHGGFQLKKYIIENIGIPITDLGPLSGNISVDYPDYAQKVVEYITKSSNVCGVLICRTGVGMSIAANKYPKIRALLCAGNENIVRLSRQHNNCNVICFGADFISTEQAVSCLKIFVHTNFEGERHQKRLDKIV